MTEPISKNVTVPLPADAAFDLFIKRMHEWWPMETHSVSSMVDGLDPALGLNIDGRLGGQIIERLADGSDSIWATITAFQPGEQLALDWYPGSEPKLATQVVVKFVASEHGTRVELTHTGFEVRGDAAEALRGNYDEGWNPVMALFTKLGEAEHV